MNRNRVQMRYLAFWLVGGLTVLTVVILLPFNHPTYAVFQASRIALLAIALLGLNLITGYAGQISLGHGFFFAIGAYLSAITQHRWDSSVMVVLPAAFLVAFGIGFAVGIPASKLSGLSLAMVTLTLAVIAPSLIRKFDSVTGGSEGLAVIKRLEPAGIPLDYDQWIYFVGVISLCVALVAMRNLTRSSTGRALKALGKNELVAACMGIDVRRHKITAFAYSAGYAGVAGALFAKTVLFVSPESFNMMLSITLLAGIVVGGLSTLRGALLGALFIVLMPTYAFEIHEKLTGVIYGVALILAMYFMPKGMAGLADAIADPMMRRFQAATRKRETQQYQGDRL